MKERRLKDGVVSKKGKHLVQTAENLELLHHHDVVTKWKDLRRQPEILAGVSSSCCIECCCICYKKGAWVFVGCCVS